MRRGSSTYRCRCRRKHAPHVGMEVGQVPDAAEERTQDPLPTIQAERIELLDAERRIQAVLGFDGALLTVTGIGPNPSTVVGVGLRPDGNIVTVGYDGTMRPRFAHTMGHGGSTLLGLDRSGSYRALVMSTIERPTGIWLVDNTGRPWCGLDLVEGTVLIELAERARGFEVLSVETLPPTDIGEPYLVLHVVPETTTTLRVLDSTGQPLWQAVGCGKRRESADTQ
jgi:hypothetical protein